MEVKKYFDNLTALTKSGQIKWTRRGAAGQMIFDCTVSAENTLSLFYETVSGRASLTVGFQEQAVGIANLDLNGDTHKALCKLWDTVLTLNLSKTVDLWFKALPELDEKIKFGPQSKIE